MAADPMRALSPEAPKLRGESMVAQTEDVHRAMLACAEMLEKVTSFSDILESWLDGGPTPARFLELQDTLREEGLSLSISIAVGRGGPWTKVDPQAASEALTSHWVEKFAVPPETLPMLSVIVELSIKMSTKALAEISEFNKARADALSMETEKFDHEKAEEVAERLINSAGAASSSMRSAAFMLHALFNGPNLSNKPSL